MSYNRAGKGKEQNFWENENMAILPDEIQNVIENAEVGGELRKLGQDNLTVREGDGIIESQGAGKGFSRVSQYWVPQCMTFEQGMSKLAEQQANIRDIKVPMTAWEPVVSDNRFAMRYKPTGRDYFPTENAMNNMAVLGQGSTWFMQDLSEDKPHRTKEDVIQFKRDGRDAQLMVDYVKLLLYQSDRFDVNKVRLFRTWDDNNTLRAVLSKDYTVVNNGWFLETIQKLLPGGLLSHWKGDGDTIFGNVLIPDTLREEEDSPYGGMLSIGNSEIGIRRITSVPSVFRAICMNGCIWGAEVGKGIDMVHRKKDGQVDLAGLAAKIKDNLEIQIPLIDAGIRLVLAVKELGFDNTPPHNVVAAVIQKLNIGKKLAKGIMQAYRVEADIVGDNAFTVMQAITRYGQTLNTFQWLNMDLTAGKIAKMDKGEWNKILKLANTFNDKDLEKIGVV